MSEISRFFNSQDDSSGEPDRYYTAADFAEYFAMLYSKGIVNGCTVNGNYYEESLIVSSNSDNESVSIAPGCALISGYQYINNGTLNLKITGTSGRIMLRLDLSKDKRCINAIAVPLSESIYKNTDVVLARYSKDSNGTLSINRDYAVYAKALYTHDFEQLKKDVQDKIDEASKTLSDVKNDTSETLNSISVNLLGMLKEAEPEKNGLNSDLLDSQHGSYYLDYNNFTNAPTIRHGTSEPADTLGKNGDIYILYEE